MKKELTKKEKEKRIELLFKALTITGVLLGIIVCYFSFKIETNSIPFNNFDIIGYFFVFLLTTNAMGIYYLMIKKKQERNFSKSNQEQEKLVLFLYSNITVYR